MPFLALTTFNLIYILPLFTATYTLLWIVYCRTLHPLAKVPGPFLASITRLWYMYRLYIGDMETVQLALHKKYGPLSRIAPNEVTSATPSAIPLIYRTQKPLLITDWYALFSTGERISRQPDIFTCIDESVHHQARRTVNPVYALGNILKLEGAVQKCTTLFVQRLGEFADIGVEVDFTEWVQMYTFDVLGQLLFDKPFGFLERGEGGGFIAQLDALMPVFHLAAIAPAYYRPFLFSILMVVPAIRRAITAMSEFEEAGVAAVARRKEEVRKGTASEPDLLQHLLDIAHSEKGQMSGFGESEVTQLCWTSLETGSDTTTIAIRATFYYLTKHPSTLSRVQAELASASPTLSSPVKYPESLKQLPYLCACIKEAARLFPSISLSIQRTAPPEGITLSGHHIPAGYRVGVNPAVVQLDADVFGEDPEFFRPERWLVEESGVKRMEKVMLQFGAGTRTCVGKNIALMMVYILVPEFLRQFDLEMDADRVWNYFNLLQSEAEERCFQSETSQGRSIRCSMRFICIGCEV